MAYEHKEGQGSLFKNEKANDRQPDFKGTILIGGVTYEVAAWERTSQKGTQYFSLQASLPRERTEQQPQQPVYQAPAKPETPPVMLEDSVDVEDLPF